MNINQHFHLQKIKNAKPEVDVASPSAVKLVQRKKLIMNMHMKQRIDKNNFSLAHKIYAIFQKDSQLANETKLNIEYLNGHPGTMNFNVRLAEAKRINHDNVILAKKLDSTKSYYNKQNFLPPFALRKSKPRAPSLKANEVSLLEPMRYSNEAGREVLTQHRREKNILLFEYSKIQDDRVIDLAVTKNNAEDDQYTVYGIDVDSGQKYELHISAGLLEGNMLITAVNDPQVWMALLNQRELLPVDDYSSHVRSPEKHVSPHAPAMPRPSVMRPSQQTSIIREAHKALSVTETRIAQITAEDEIARVSVTMNYLTILFCL